MMIARLLSALLMAAMCITEAWAAVAAGTTVTTEPGMTAPIGTIKVGDTVLSMQHNGAWQKAPVVFSDGVPRLEANLFYVTVETGISLIATADHPLLMPDGSLKRAFNLTPQDFLVGENGKPLRIVRIAMGMYHGAIHAITVTSSKQTKDLSGHLISTNGIISGDYYAQSHLVNDMQALPRQ